MNKRIIFIICIVLFLIFGITSYSYFERVEGQPASKHKALWSNYEIRDMTIEGQDLRLVVADNPERWQKGLMFVRKPVSEYDGMVFIFPDYEYRTFWNLNTFENLTLYWMKDSEITSTSDLPSIEQSKEIVRVSSTKPVNMVVEVIK